VAGYIIIALLQIVCRVCQLKNLENQSITGEDMDKSKVPHFLWPTVDISYCKTQWQIPDDITNVVT